MPDDGRRRQRRWEECLPPATGEGRVRPLAGGGPATLGQELDHGPQGAGEAVTALALSGQLPVPQHPQAAVLLGQISQRRLDGGQARRAVSWSGPEPAGPGGGLGSNRTEPNDDSSWRRARMASATALSGTRHTPSTSSPAIWPFLTRMWMAWRLKPRAFAASRRLYQPASSSPGSGGIGRSAIVARAHRAPACNRFASHRQTVCTRLTRPGRVRGPHHPVASASGGRRGSRTPGMTYV